jgi:hypothetical protein
MHDRLAQAAVLPFRIVETMGVPCGYERSFKLTRQTILANRYLLGIETSRTNSTQLLDACRQLGMPQCLMDAFQAQLPEANLVFLGFEADEAGGAIYKVYLEFWDQLRRDGTHENAGICPGVLHRGFKWRFDDPGKAVVTEYQLIPNLGCREIRERIRRMYATIASTDCLESITSIIEMAQARIGDAPLLFVEVSESGNSRMSFDLNLYPAGLQIAQIAPALGDAIARLDVPREKFARLLKLTAGKLFGHLSGGTGRDGQEYLTVYYEN